MSFIKFQLALVVVFSIVTAHADDVDTYCTNRIACANGRAVLFALVDGNAQDQTNVQTLIGSLVALAGKGWHTMGANLLVETNTTIVPIRSNVLIDVELKPSRDVRPMAGEWRVIVMGTLKNVDFKKRIIYIQAKPENWVCYQAD